VGIIRFDISRASPELGAHSGLRKRRERGSNAFLASGDVRGGLVCRLGKELV